MMELISRIRAVLRRAAPQEKAELLAAAHSR
jgi:DNA-binding response OmpR family regulator